MTRARASAGRAAAAESSTVDAVELGALGLDVVASVAPWIDGGCMAAPVFLTHDRVWHLPDGFAGVRSILELPGAEPPRKTLCGQEGIAGLAGDAVVVLADIMTGAGVCADCADKVQARIAQLAPGPANTNTEPV